MRPSARRDRRVRDTGRLRLVRRWSAAVGEYRSVALPGLGALAANSVTSLVAGAVLGSLTETFERLPGLLVLVPAAIGLRGNVFSSLGSRLSTAIHTGTFRPTLRPGTVMGDNVAAALLLTVGFSFVLAAVAKTFAVVFGVPDSIPLTDLALVALACAALAWVLLPADSLGYWTRELWRTERIAGSLDYTSNQSLLGMATRLVPDPIARPAWVGLRRSRCWRGETVFRAPNQEHGRRPELSGMVGMVGGEARGS